MAHNIHIGQKTKTMKNIHVLPTDKLSSLYLGKNGNFVFGMMQTSVQSKNDHFCNQHIYITSDKEIKVGDWFLPQGNINPHKLKEYNKINGDLESYNGLCYDISKCKKIILTTDQDLIKDGVQAIDDEFLEWVVNNPSCEMAKVVKEKQHIGEEVDKSYPQGFFDYKIIIPKEEPKQNCKHDIVIKYGVAECQNCGMEENEIVKEEPKQKDCSCTDKCLGYLTKTCKRIEEPKQETVEEAAERIYREYPNGPLDKPDWRYNRDVNCFKKRKAFIAGAKWQAERMYSEEDLHNAFYNGWLYRGEDYQFPKAKKEWFEQFKKK